MDYDNLSDDQVSSHDCTLYLNYYSHDCKYNTHWDGVIYYAIQCTQAYTHAHTHIHTYTHAHTHIHTSDSNETDFCAFEFKSLNLIIIKNSSIEFQSGLTRLKPDSGSTRLEKLD